jgi:hypothetical protein
MNTHKRTLLWLALFLLSLASPLAAAPVVFQNVFYSKTTGVFLNGTYTVSANIRTAAKILYTEQVTSVVFKKGFFDLTLGKNKVLSANVMASPNTYLTLQINQDISTFSIAAVPFAQKAQVAEEAFIIPASIVQGTFISSVNIQSALAVTTTANASLLRVSPVFKTVSIGGNPRSDYKLDVAGIVNAKNLFVNGVDIRNTLAWKPQTTNTKNIYFVGGQIGIGTSFPRFDLHIGNILQAKAYLLNGQKLSTSLDWKRSQVSSSNIYYNDLTSRVGIGIANPQSKLDVRGGLRLGTTASSNVGTMRWNGTQFQGYGYSTSTQNAWLPFARLDGLGIVNTLAYWTGLNLTTAPNSLAGSVLLTLNGTNGFLGIGLTNSQARVAIKETALSNLPPLLHVASSTSPNLLWINASGNMGIGTTNAKQKLRVLGLVTARDFTVNGDNLRLAFSLHDHWTRRPITRDIYYMLGNVGIGRPDPQSLLEIAQPNGAPGVDPAITFTSSSTGVKYIMGVSSKFQQTFRIEKGSVLGTATPIFVAQQDRWGIGVAEPKANLTVSGNAGISFVGGFSATTSSNPISGPGTRLLWHPQKASLTVGRITPTSNLSGKEWDGLNLGLFSMVFGLNNMVSGNLSTVMGGTNNRAGGAYATVFGGALNRASGDFSFAGGQGANAAHHGTFVWADPQNLNFGTQAENQFLIRAGGGVGIGTNQTLFTALTVSRNATTGTVFRFQDLSGVNSVLFSVTGNTIIGGTVGTPFQKLTVHGLFTLGTPTPLGTFTVLNDPKLTNIVNVVGNQGVASPSFVINSTGNVGIGMYPDLKFLNGASDNSGRGYLQIASGSITATVFKFPDGQQISTAAPNYVWQYKHTTPNIFYVSGNVGVGISSPVRMLTLSNVGGTAFGRPIDPSIGFDLDGVSYYNIGVSRFTPRVFKIATGNAIGKGSFAVSGNRVGINTASPRSFLDVNGKMLITGKMAVSTSNISSAYALNVGGRAAVTRMFLNGSIISPGGTPFQVLSTPERLYFDSNLDPLTASFVGIGTTVPKAEIAVVGTVNISGSDTFSLYVNRFQVNNDLFLNLLKFRDVVGQDQATLFVDKKRLFINSTTLRSISDIFSRGNGESGYLTLWAVQPNVPTFTFIVESRLKWTQPTANNAGILETTGNIAVNRTITDTSSFKYSNATTIGANTDLTPFVDVNSAISHNGLLPNSKSHSGATIGVTLDKWGTLAPASRGFVAKGLEITLKQPSSVAFSTNGMAVGLDVDVTNVALQNVGDKGYKYAALFLTGTTKNVGINTTPNAELDVKGTVSANFFVISQQLAITTINVLNSMTIPPSKFVGVGTSLPRSALEVIGGIKANTVKTKVADMHSFLASQSNVSITRNQVGLGTLTPVAQFELNKVFNGLVNSPFTFHNIGVTLNIDTVANPGAANKPIKGLDVKLASYTDSRFVSTPNFLGDLSGEPSLAKGARLDLSGLNLATGNMLTGLNVVVPTVNTLKSNAAIFQGGFVGIGTSTPAYALDVVGSIYATNAPVTKLLTQQESASFNNLVVSSGPPPSMTTLNMVITGPAYMNTLKVVRLTQNRLVLNQPLKLSTAELFVPNTFTASNVSVNVTRVKDFQNQSTISTQYGSFRSIGIGTTTALGLSVSTIVSANSMRATHNVQAQSVSVNHTFYVINGLVGVGTTLPQFSLDIVKDPLSVLGVPTVFSPSNNYTWNAVPIQSTTAAANSAAGLLWAPDGSSLSTIGSGIAAIRSAASTSTASHLVLITDSQTGNPAERMRITEAGRIGVGRTNPLSVLHVSGNVKVRNDIVLLQTPLLIKQLNGNNGLVFATTVNIPVTVNMSQSLGLEKTIRLRPVSTIIYPASDEVSFYADGSTSQLYLAGFLSNGDKVSGNLSVTVSSSTRSLAYYNDKHRLSDSLYLNWVTSNVSSVLTAVLRVTSTNMLTVPSGQIQVKIDSLVPSTSVASSFSAKKINGTFLNRTSASSMVFTGMDVRFPGGFLGLNETAVGLKVNLSDSLKASTFTSLGVPVVGSKYAAVFLSGSETSGNVAIITSSNVSTLPSANLHLISKIPSQSAMSVDFRTVSGTANALSVDNLGRVGIGGTSSGRFLVKGLSTSSSDTALGIENKDGTSLFVLKNDGKLGIGNSVPQTALDVAGETRGTSLVVRNLNPRSLSVSQAQGGLVVTSEGLVGIGTSTPRAQLDVVKPFASQSELANPFSLEKITLTHPAGVDVLKNVTGVELKITANRGVTLGSTDGTGVGVMGLKVDLTGAVTGGPASHVHGVYTDVTHGAMSASRNAAVFLGGKVGIGTTTPTAMLDLSGGILKARSLFASVTLNIAASTFNRIVILSNMPSIADLKVGSRVTAKTLVFGGDLSTKIIRTGPLKEEFLGKVITSKVTTLNAIGINGASLASQRPLAVSGSVYISKDLKAQPITLNVIAGIGGMMIVSANRLHLSSGLIQVTGDIKTPVFGISGAVATPSQKAGYGVMYVNNSSKELLYNAGSGTINISVGLKGAPGTLSYYDLAGRLSGSRSLRTVTTNIALGYQTLRVTATPNAGFSGGAQVATSAINVSSVIPDTTNTFKGSRIRMDFGTRITAAATRFQGVNVTMNGALHETGGNFDRVYGLKVDMTALNSDSQDGNGIAKKGNKIAAVFKSGTDTTGNVGIFVSGNMKTFRPSADFHVVSNLLSGGLSHGALRVDSMENSVVQTGILIVTNNARVGIGGVMNPGSKVVVKGKTTLSSGSSLHVTNASDASLFYVQDDGKIGIGTSQPAQAVTLVGGTTAPLLTIKTNNAAYASFTKDGFLGLGALAPSAQVHVVLDAVANPSIGKALIVSANGSSRGIQVEASSTKGVSFGATPPSVFALSVSSSNFSSKVFSGSYDSTALPTYLRYTSLQSPTLNGLLSQSNGGFAFLGLRNRNEAPTRGVQTLVWGSPTAGSRDLIFMSGDGSAASEKMRFTGTGFIGVGNSTPSASLHVANAGTLPLFSVISLTNPTRSIWVNKGVGIGTTTPRAELDVNGLVMLTKVERAPKGTLMETPDFVVTYNVNSGGTSYSPNLNFNIVNNVTSKETTVVNKVQTTLSQDIQKSLAGVSIVMKSKTGIGVTNTTSSSKKYAIGLLVNIPDLSIEDPVWAGNKGNYSAANFLGGRVVIGPSVTRNVQDDIVRIDASTVAYRSSPTFSVFAMNAKGNSKSTGNIAGFSIKGGLGPTLNIRSYGRTSANTSVSPLVFMAAGLTSAQSIAIFNNLISGGGASLVDPVDNYSLRAAANVPAYTPPGSLSVASANAVRMILDRHRNKQVYDFISKVGSTVSTNIFITSGTDWNGVSDYRTMNRAYVGFGFKTPNSYSAANVATALRSLDKHLVVSGNVRIGVTSNAVTLGSEGVGAKLFFSGGPVVKSGGNSDNGNELWMGRYNSKSTESQLRVSVGTSDVNNPNAYFTVVTKNADETVSSTSPMLSLNVTGYRSPASIAAARLINPNAALPPASAVVGYLGIATQNPQATLHVYGKHTSVSPTTTGVPMLVENSITSTTAQQPANLLAIKLSAPTDESSNYMSFLVPSTNASDKSIKGPKVVLGAIESDSISSQSGIHSVQFSSAAGDYAEYLRKANPAEPITAADIVGVTSGYVSKSTDGAQHVMVISSAPIIAGNWPGKDTSGFALVAFMGQVKIKVRGLVTVGDYILASGLNDGTGIAVSPQQMSVTQWALVVGRAWESSSNTALKTVNALVGFPYQVQGLATNLRQIADLQTEADRIRIDNQTLKTALQKQLDDRQKRINELKLKIQGKVSKN